MPRVSLESSQFYGYLNRVREFCLVGMDATALSILEILCPLVTRYENFRMFDDTGASRTMYSKQQISVMSALLLFHK